MPAQISQEEWEQMEELAGLCFTPTEIAIIMQWPQGAVVLAFEDNTSDFYLHYKRGEYLHLTQVRKAIYNLAKGGSSTSQSDYLKLRKAADIAIQKIK